MLFNGVDGRALAEKEYKGLCYQCLIAMHVRFTIERLAGKSSRCKFGILSLVLCKKNS